jgi:S1-C subfamily serine protease
VKPPPEEKKEEAGFLGVGVGSVEGGLEVEIVVPDSAAAAYGIQVGDVIKQVNGKKTTSIDELKAALGGASAGATVKVNLTRKGADIAMSLVLGARGAKVEPPKSQPAAPKPETTPKPKEKPKEKPPEKKSEAKGTLGIHARQTGEGQVVITMVIPGAAAQKGGLKAGDLVLKFGGKAIGSLKDLQEALGPMHAGDSVTVKIRRGEEEKDIKVKLSEPLSSGSED